jgi:peptidoglycan L-alanyl-D-glutamate endopeptidase CwlK
MSTKDVNKINRDYSKLAPFFSEKLRLAIQECNEAGLNVALFEGLRSPDRQDFLFGQGRTREGNKVTNAMGWQSWHQYGVAADLCFKENGNWTWKKGQPWDQVHAIFHKHGFETLKFEKAHVQITGGMSVRKAMTIAQKDGLLALWSIIQSGVLF